MRAEVKRVSFGTVEQHVRNSTSALYVKERASIMVFIPVYKQPPYYPILLFLERLSLYGAVALLLGWRRVIAG